MKERLYQYLLHLPQKVSFQIAFLCIVGWSLLTWLHLRHSLPLEIEFLIMFMLSLTYNFFFFGKMLVADIDAEPRPGVFRKITRYLFILLMVVMILGLPFCYGMAKYYENQVAHYRSLLKNTK